MVINEVFKSIQGEGRYMGVPVVFVRTQGCSLRCPFCDQNNTWAYTEKEFKPEEVLGMVESKMRIPGIIVITGGEPTEQNDLYQFVRIAKYEGWKCHLETNGTEDIASGYFDWVVCSPKERNEYRVPKGVDELKYVIKNGDDINHIIDAGVRHKFARRIWLQPMANGDEIVAENVRFCYEQVMKDNRLRLGFQFHKYLGVR